jgi:hypothetical protein
MVASIRIRMYSSQRRYFSRYLTKTACAKKRIPKAPKMFVKELEPEWTRKNIYDPATLI